MSRTRVYLDHAASAPLCAPARAAMAAALDVTGNPSSVHAEGRAARGLVERARADLAQALGADPEGVVFTSGATEAAALALRGRGLRGAAVEHDAVLAWIHADLPVDDQGRVAVPDPAAATLQWANGETGVIQDLPPGLAVTDATQAVGKLPVALGWSGVGAAIVSAHKFGGPRGAGALILAPGAERDAILRGGGQERGRRAGTENVPGIAGMAAAATHAAKLVADGAWERVAQLRDILEEAIAATASQTIFVGKGAARLPGHSCMIAPGWRGETQVMAMDLAGFAVSAGSACSSGKVAGSRVLAAMGVEGADCALRVSIGPDTARDDLLRFAETWGRQAARRAPAHA
ncbi:MAG: cysteine desulfurase family protein [Paracoccaceae bacterium]